MRLDGDIEPVLGFGGQTEQLRAELDEPPGGNWARLVGWLCSAPANLN